MAPFTDFISHYASSDVVLMTIAILSASMLTVSIAVGLTFLLCPRALSSGRTGGTEGE